MDTTVRDQVLQALRRRETSADGFDIHAHLATLLRGIGLAPDAAGGTVRFEGADPIVPSVFRLASAAGLGLVAKSVALGALWRERTGEGQDIHLDLRCAPRRLCPFYEAKWELLNGHAPRNPADPGSPFALSFYPTRDGRWVMPLNLYPRLKTAALRFLDCADDPAKVAAAIARRDAAELEAAGSEAGIVMPMLRDAEEFLAEPQFAAGLAALPLVEIERIGDAAPVPFTPHPRAPLSGLRALGMGRVIAGAGIGRALALHGADVLNLWRPQDFEIDLLYATANVGVRSATVDPASAAGAPVARALLRGADVFYTNRRPDLLRRIGLDAEAACAARPGLVHASVTLHGRAGPWADRPGFDQTAGCVTGVMNLEGSVAEPALPPIKVVNDYLCSWLATAGIVAALRRRAVEGGSWRVHVALTRVSLWLYSLGLFDKAYSHAVAGSAGRHEHRTPELFEADTPLGRYRGVTDQVRMSATPGHYGSVLLPRGGGSAAWR
jgi:crotonobetainyl-CoA:carnitine CoA-transferase CaiB-like acyl-CoA transferase